MSKNSNTLVISAPRIKDSYSNWFNERDYNYSTAQNLEMSPDRLKSFLENLEHPIYAINRMLMTKWKRLKEISDIKESTKLKKYIKLIFIPTNKQLRYP